MMSKIISVTFTFVAILILPLVLICGGDPTGIRVIGIWLLNIALATVLGVFLFRRNREDISSHLKAVW